MDINYIASEYVLPETPGAPLPLIAQQILRATTEFCIETHIYTSPITPVNLTSGVRTYTISPSEPNTTIVRPLVLWIGDKILSPARLQDVEKAAVILNGTGTPIAYTFTQPDKILLFPTPNDVSNSLNGRIAVMPADGSTTLPDWLTLRYMDTITAGAKARLMAMQNKPWSQFDLAARFSRIFSAGITNAKIDANKSHTLMDMVIANR